MGMKKKANILEAIRVTGATFIGSDRGFDLFKIETWDAAQEFRTVSGDRAGIKYVQNESTFNDNMVQENGTPRYSLYFYVEEDTNKVYTAILREHGSARQYKLTVEGTDITFNVRGFSLEDMQQQPSILHKERIIPLYLLPFIDTDNTGSYVCEDCGLYAKGVYIKDEQFLGVLGWATPLTTVDTFEVPENVNTVARDVCSYGVHINNLKIKVGGGHSTILSRSNGRMVGINDIYYVYPDGTETSIDPNNVSINNTEEEPLEAGDSTEVAPSITNSEEEIEPAVIPEPEHRTEIQKGRKYSYISDWGNVSIYKLEDDGIHIVEIPDIEGNGEYHVPNEIEDIAVVAIDAYAAFGNENITNLIIGDKLKSIGKSAFAYCPNLSVRASSRVPGRVKVYSNAFKRMPSDF